MDKKLANKRTDRVLWLDLEMTGLSAADDLIMEVAIIATDWDFNEIATYNGIVKNDEKLLQKRFVKNSDFWDKNPQSRDDLFAQNSKGKPLAKIEKEILSFIKKNFKSDIPVLLAGNSIHIDRQFISVNWPNFNKKLHYRMLDVSAWKVVFDGKFGKRYAKPDMHRALDDIRGSISELQYYLNHIN